MGVFSLRAISFQPLLPNMRLCHPCFHAHQHSFTFLRVTPRLGYPSFLAYPDFPSCAFTFLPATHSPLQRFSRFNCQVSFHYLLGVLEKVCKLKLYFKIVQCRLKKGQTSIKKYSEIKGDTHDTKTCSEYTQTPKSPG